LDSADHAEGGQGSADDVLLDIGMTIWRVVGGFVLAAIIAVRLGAYKPIEGFLKPFVSFAVANDLAPREQPSEVMRLAGVP
jgi:ABC-type nitrate/sulfonate/bicarbonate transport system permease component